MNNASRPSQDSIEKSLVEWVSFLLDTQDVRRETNFFALGGDSILAALLINRVRDKFHVEIPIAQLFNTPTISVLATYIQKAHQNHLEIR